MQFLFTVMISIGNKDIDYPEHTFSDCNISEFSLLKCVLLCGVLPAYTCWLVAGIYNFFVLRVDNWLDDNDSPQ